MKHLVKTLVEQLAQLPCFNEVQQVRTIDSGMSSYTYQVHTKQGCFFAKFIGINLADYQGELHHNNENNHLYESNIHQFLALKGLAPKVFYSDQHWLICHYVAGGELQQVRLPLESKLHIAMYLMQQFHQTDFSQTNIVLDLLDIGQVLDGLIKKEHFTQVQLAALLQVKSYLLDIVEVSGTHPCHGDLNFTNILTQQKLPQVKEGNFAFVDAQLLKDSYLIDFDCCCLADIEYDIAMLLAVNHFEYQDHHIIFHVYEKLAKTYQLPHKHSNIDTKKVTHYFSFSCVINGLWFFNKFKQTEQHHFIKLAFKQFMLFDSLAKLPFSLAEQMR